MKHLLTPLLVLLPVMIFSQTARLNYANKQYEQMAYHIAVEAYEDVLERGIDSISIASQVADCYYQINHILKAEKWLDYVRYNKRRFSAKEHMRLALLKRQVGDYDTSMELFKSYAETHGHNDITKHYLQSSGISSLTKKSEFFDNVKSTNVSDASDISVSFIDEENVLFASSKKNEIMSLHKTGQTGDYFYDLYTSKIDSDGNIVNPTVVEGEVNTKFHDGPGTYDPTNQVVYFTRNNYIKGSKQYDGAGVMRLKILRGNYSNGTITNVTEMPFNSNEYSCAQPSVSSDGNTLFFASDMPGGHGGTDIYRVEKNESGQWGKPVNMGNKVNTSLNEMSPFIHPGNKLFLFSSEGHFGLGGLDIFYGSLDENKNVVSIKNLGAPINSPYDDFSFVNDKEQKLGYVTSNRRSDDDIAAKRIINDNIYVFKQLKPLTFNPIVEGLVTDLFEGVQLENVLITIEDERGRIIDSTRTSPNGTYSIDLKDLNKDFVLRASKGKYLDEEIDITFEITKDIYKSDFELAKKLDYFVSGQILDENSKEELQNVAVTLMKYDADISTSLEYNTNKKGWFTSDLLAKKYNEDGSITVQLEKDGYHTRLIDVMVKFENQNEIVLSEIVNMNMEKVRDGGPTLVDPTLVEFDERISLELNRRLPVTLYFHNDMPNPRTTMTTTRVSYYDSYNDYMRMVDEYKREYAKGLSGAKADQAEKEIEQFFKKDVEGGVENLNEFNEILLEALKRGRKIQMTVKGFASPLAHSSYNVALTKRRIASLENYLMKYNNGAFKQFLENTASNGGQLMLVQMPFGDYGSQIDSDNPNDLRNSIYSKAAALERKIEVRSIEIVRAGDSLTNVLSAVQPVLDLGRISGSKTVKHTFKIINTGQRHITIEDVKTSCDCATASVGKKELTPGESTQVTMTLDPTKVNGKFLKSTFIKYSRAEEPLELVMMGIVD